ncbi:MAG: histidine--tRNA ligase [Elusimicrobia bacterium GWA2_56_46]|nr:MAG: histidine--tRNA ligase [Elusimicrobia bacterium GWA2_56_46]OGR56251.1 MAG: histidine--tRNA ligase [Elusimicrobia bacterium GWC2_56_31]HBB66334.1 histidine--tRNA ligase [Elusimicrobiota bacterium]HBW22383.1 histidine--tRNA ligase [Elusimicrobiota bacterium]
MTIHTLRGFRDLLPPESDIFVRIETAAREVFALYGYREIRIPTIESKELFVKSTGDTTDIVEKEMYAFTDQGNREVAVRPEGTPGVVRAYIEHNLSQTGRNGKYFYIGGMFRAERPQAGRYREFTQIGAEHFGNPSPFADAETIAMLVKLLEKTGVTGLSVEINSLGCAECRKTYRETLLNHLRLNVSTLCEPCKNRIERNPLRALDCKIDGPALAEKAPRLALCAPCAQHFDRTRALLESSGVGFKVNPGLVRGLDYYTRTVFEVKTSALGSQDAVAAGGRYDDLVKSMGGPQTPAIGWGLGLDRVALLLKDTMTETGPGTFLVSASKEAQNAAFKLLGELRAAGISADFSDFELSLKSQMRSADKSGASLALIIGEDELKTGAVAVKPLKNPGGQRSVPLSDVISEIKKSAF